MTTHASFLRNLVPISDFSHGKASAIFKKITDSAPVTVVKNNRPIAVITTPEEFEHLSEAEEDIVLLEMALERVSSNEGKPAIPESEVLAKLGISQEDLDAVPESEIEFE